MFSRIHLSQLARFLQRGASGPSRGYLVALSTAAISVFGIAGLSGMELPGPAPVSDTDRLRIEVVQPPDPPVAPGSVMDVGELVDGFNGVLPPPMPAFVEIWSGEEDWDEFEPSPRRDRREFAGDVHAPPATVLLSGPPPRHVERWFGFDAPRRDYQAERAARRARLEALDRRDRERRYDQADAERRAYERDGDDRRWPGWNEPPPPYDGHDAAAESMTGLRG